MYNNSLNELGSFSQLNFCEEIVIFTQNFTKLLYILIPLPHIRFKMPTITVSEQPHVTLSQSVFVNAKPVESCLENVSDWLSYLPQKGESLALKRNQMNRYRPWRPEWVYTWGWGAWWGCPNISISAQSKHDLCGHVGQRFGSQDTRLRNAHSITSMTVL